MKNKIKTFEDACKALGLDPLKVLPDFSAYPEEDHAAMIAHAKLVLIAKALNKGWKPDWDNFSQRKYYPWFNMDSGSGFSYHDFGSDGTGSFVGSRLCFQNSDLAEYAGKQFEDLYKEYFTLN